jgi:hypothetical protein
VNHDLERQGRDNNPKNSNRARVRIQFNPHTNSVRVTAAGGAFDLLGYQSRDLTRWIYLSIQASMILITYLLTRKSSSNYLSRTSKLLGIPDTRLTRAHLFLRARTITNGG